MQTLQVREAMGSVPAAISIDTPVPEIVTRLSGSELEAPPVIDAAGRYRGVVSARQLERALANSRSDTTAGDLAEQPPTVSLDLLLTDALPMLLHGEASRLTVLAEQLSGRDKPADRSRLAQPSPIASR